MPILIVRLTQRTYLIFLGGDTADPAPGQQASSLISLGILPFVFGVQAGAAGSENPSYEDLLALEELIGYGHPLASRDSVERELGSFVFSPDPAEDEECGDHARYCTICLGAFGTGELVRKLKCTHSFHCECIDVWLTGHRNSCPLCRQAAV